MWFKRKQKNRRLSRGHVLDVKLRSEQVRATRIRLALVAVSVPAVTIFGLYLLWRAGDWALDNSFMKRRVRHPARGSADRRRHRAGQLAQLVGRETWRESVALDLALVKHNLEFWPVMILFPSNASAAHLKSRDRAQTDCAGQHAAHSTARTAS